MIKVKNTFFWDGMGFQEAASLCEQRPWVSKGPARLYACPFQPVAA